MIRLLYKSAYISVNIRALNYTSLIYVVDIWVSLNDSFSCLAKYENQTKGRIASPFRLTGMSRPAKHETIFVPVVADE